MIRISRFFTITFLFMVGVFQEGGALELQPLSGMASFEVGRLEEVFLNESNTRDKEFLQRGSAWLVQDVKLSEVLDIHLGVGVMSYTVIHRDGVPDAQSRRTVPTIARASGRYKPWGGNENKHLLAVEAGLFPFKYNTYAKNLGEYMFRTWVNPIQISTGGLDIIEMAGAYLTGIRADGYIGDGLHWDVFFTVNMNNIPLLTRSLTFMADYNFGKIFELGAGLQFQHLFYDRKSEIQPKKTINMTYKAKDATGKVKYFDATFLNDENYTTPCDPSDDPVKCSEQKTIRKVQQDSNTFLIGYDSYPPGGAETFIPQWTVTDSVYNSYKGGKLMARAAINLSRLIGMEEMPGEKGLAVYAEAILLGLKPVPVWAESIKERMPVMFGVNLPTFKLLDAFSIEFEVLKLKYPTSTANVISADAIPKYAANGPDVVYDTDDWKFTIFAQKTVTPGFTIMGQVARDHFRTMDIFGKPEFYEVTERGGGSFTDWGDFYWLLKFKYMF